MTATTISRTLTRRRAMLPVAGPPRSLAAPEALPGFERVASDALASVDLRHRDEAWR